MKFKKALALLFMLAVAPVAYSAPNLTATLSSPADPVKAASGYLDLTLANSGDSVAHVFSYSTPFFNDNDPRLAGDQFEIIPYFPTPDTVFPKVAFSGESLNPVETKSSMFLSIQPGQSVTVTVNLFPDYAIHAGQGYLITYSVVTGWTPEVFDVGTAADFAGETFQTVTSNTLNVVVSQNPSISAISAISAMQARMSAGSAQPLLPGDLPPGYPECTGDQLTALGQSSYQAQQLAQNAYGQSYAYMFNPNGYDPSLPQSQLYKTYFGAYGLPTGSHMMSTHADYDNGLLDGLIAMTLRQIISRRDHASYSCGCTDPRGLDRYKDTAATAQQATPYLVKICPKFWTLGRTGSPSQAAVLFHEYTHFADSFSFNDGQVPYAVRATADWAYYPPASKLLATQSRDRASANADNYLYYAIEAAVATNFPGW